MSNSRAFGHQAPKVRLHVFICFLRSDLGGRDELMMFMLFLSEKNSRKMAKAITNDAIYLIFCKIIYDGST
jgi:hypothetical protein